MSLTFPNHLLKQKIIVLANVFFFQTKQKKKIIIAGDDKGEYKDTYLTGF